MNSVVTFDTNFIIENKNDIATIISDVKENYEVVITKIVIEEVKGQKIRQILMKMEQVIKDLKIQYYV